MAVTGIAAVMSVGLDPGFAQGLGDVATLLASALAVLACTRAARLGGHDARGWALLAFAAAVWTAGQLAWTWYGFTKDHTYPFPSAADIGFLGYAVPAVAALLSFGRNSVPFVSRLRGLLDGLVIASSIIFTTWAVILGPTYRAGSAQGLSYLTGLAYPIVDATMAALVLVLAMRRPPGARLPWAFLAGGLLTLAATDTVYVALTLRGESGVTGTPLAAGWVAAFLLIAVATLAEERPASPGQIRNLTVGQELLPYLPVGIALVVAARVNVFVDPFLVVAGSAVLVTVGIRQVLILVEKVALTGSLEDRVERRTAELRNAQDDLRQAFEKTRIGIAWADMAGVLVRVNPVFCELLGRSRDELVGSAVRDITAPADRAATERIFRQAATTKESAFPRVEKRYLNADGGEVWAEVDLTVTVNAIGTPQYLVAQVHEITDRRAAARALADQTTFLEAVLEHLDSGVVACDAEGQLTLLNRASRELHGLSGLSDDEPPEEWAQHYNLYRADGITPLPTHEIPLVRALRGEHVRDAEVVIVANHAEPRTLVVNGHSITDGDGVLLGAVVAFQDITARRKAEAALTRLALHDPLTDLANQALLQDRLEHAFARLERQPGLLALLLMDLDGFKLVNDSLGHQAGDDVLVTLAGRLQACLRPYDTIARLGGDEFAVVLEDTSEGQAFAIARDILATVREPILVQDRPIAADASIGIAVNTGVDNPASLLRNADLAMYAAKDSGKGHVQVFTPSMHEAALQRLTLDAELRAAIDKRQFTLVYQPIVSLITGQLQGFEALLRWNHPDRGVVSPSTFIPLAESTGLIVPLGQWVIREACRKARLWRRIHPDAQDLVMSVNMSIRQLQDPAIFDIVAAALADADLPARNLQLEITESVMDERGQALPALDRLHATGVRLALDDFGAGYSSLGRMHSLPIDSVKIDKSFIDALADGGAAPMVAASIAMAHSLGLQTVAEGVETVDQLPLLRVHGCDAVQGYLFGRPVTAAAIDALLWQRGTGTMWTDLDIAAAGGSTAERSDAVVGES